MFRFAWIVRLTFVIAALVAAGCDRSDRGVALPAAYVHRDAVPIGGPVDITLGFRVSPSAAPFPDDCRVLLRFLYDDGSVMASDDHDPPTPAREWRPGAAISYTRRIFAPDVPYVGDVSIVMGLASRSGKRLALSGKERGDRTYEVGTLKLNSQRTLLVYRGGWHQPESIEAGPAWRGTTGVATMSFFNPHRDAVLHLRLDGSPDRFDSPQHVSILVGDRLLRTIEARTSEATDYEVPVAAADFGPSREPVLTIKVDKTFVASPPGRGRDTRELGVRVYNVFLAPRDAPSQDPQPATR